jgi:hypothetical protein
MSRKLQYEEAAQEIIDFIGDCDATTFAMIFPPRIVTAYMTLLACVYEQCFGAVESCQEAEDGDYFIVTYYEGLEPG